MTYYVASKVKSLLGEAGATNDAKVQLYGDMADAYINTDLTKVEDIVPIIIVPVLVSNIANLLTVAYFYRFESGDTLTLEEAKLLWKQYFTSRYKRPRVIASTGRLR